jgi:hypothetical protein
VRVSEQNAISDGLKVTFLDTSLKNAIRNDGISIELEENVIKCLLSRLDFSRKGDSHRSWLKSRELEEGKSSESSPFFILVRHEKLVHLPAFELQLVFAVLGDGDVVGDGVVLGGEELLERQHRWLGESVGNWRCVVFPRAWSRSTTSVRVESTVGIVEVAVTTVHSSVVHPEPSTHAVTSFLEIRSHSFHGRRRVTRRPVVITS